MAFASIGSLGNTNSKTSGQTLSISPSSAVPVGHLVVVWAAAISPDGNGEDLLGKVRDGNYACTDDAGNIYTTLTCGYSVASLAIGSAMFIAYVDHALSTSNVITVTARATNIPARAMSVEEFSIGNGKRWCVYRDLSSGFEDSSTTGPNKQPSNMSVSGMASEEHLILHVLGNLRPVSDSYTWDSDYTQIVADGTTGGAANSNVTLRGGFRIVTGTSDTVSTHDDTANSDDIMQGICALVEVDYDGDFPTFPNLDRFNRADEDPLATPPWSNSTTVLPGQGTARLRVASNQCARSASGTFHGSQFWQDPIPAGDDGEVFATLAVVGNAGLHMFASGSGQNSTLSGYATYWFPITGNRPDKIEWGTSGDSGGIATRFMISWTDQATGAKWGLQLRGNGTFMHQWLDHGTGWRWIGCAKITGGDYRNSGYFGINLQNDTTVRIDDFGGGTSSPFLPQIIRRLPVNR